jgi:putative ABC transport system permease protein
VSTLTRKAWVDLRRRPARTVLTMCTLGLAIASLSTVAVPALMDRAMHGEVRTAKLHDLSVTTHDTVLSPAQLSELAHLPNVAAFDARSVYSTRVAVGGRQQHAVIWGLDFTAQPVDTIRLTRGHLPGPGQVLADAGDGKANLPVAIGDHAEVARVGGGRESLTVSGIAHSVATSPNAVGPNDNPVFYTELATIGSIASTRGVNTLAFRLVDNGSAAAQRTAAAVHSDLKAQTGSEPFVDLPDIRSPGDWPGRSTFSQVSSLFYLITALAVLCALFLIANTMNTLVAEQASEIAILKTLGGRRRQIAGVFLRTAALLGATGALVGTSLGVAIAYLLTRFFATTIFDVSAGFAVSIPVTVISLVAGPVLAIAASLPGLRRALRRPVAEVLTDEGVSGYGTGRLDRLVARSQLLPGPARMGVRNVLRHKRRSAATVAQVAIATALALALFALGRSVTLTVNRIYTTLHYDIELSASNGAPLLDSRARTITTSTPGVTGAEPVVENRATYRGHNYAAYGLGARTLYQYQLKAGRWFTPADASATTPPVVLGPAVARTTGARIGQTLVLDTAAGTTTVQVVGIDTGQLNNGGVVYFPIAVLQRLTGMGEATNAVWLTTAQANHAAVDQATAKVEDRLAAGGYPVDTTKLYVQQADNRASNNTLLTVIEVMGLLVVAITLIGLVSALTMGVIERTREIGILRCLGAKARDIRRVFGAEGTTLAILGWAVAIPVGWLISRGLLAFIRHEFGVDITPVFPAISVPIALVAVIAVTLLVIRPPLRRASRIQPGTALRYQ